MERPAYFETVRRKAAERWDQLEADPELAAPWHQLFRQVQSPRHVVSELLQNADDAGATRARVRIDDGTFIFEHNGADFTDEHFASLCRLATPTSGPCTRSASEALASRVRSVSGIGSSSLRQHCQSTSSASDSRSPFGRFERLLETDLPGLKWRLKMSIGVMSLRGTWTSGWRARSPFCSLSPCAVSQFGT